MRSSQKVQEYQEAGVKLVWVIYPDQRVVMVYHLDGRVEKLTTPGVLTGGDVLPGFTLALTRLFPAAKQT